MCSLQSVFPSGRKFFGGRKGSALVFSTVITGLCVVKPSDCWKRPVAMTVSAHPAKKQCTLLKEKGAALATAGEADVAHCVHLVDASETPPQLQTRPSRSYK